jgi:hypothetical protein
MAVNDLTVLNQRDAQQQVPEGGAAFVSDLGRHVLDRPARGHGEAQPISRDVLPSRRDRECRRGMSEAGSGRVRNGP